MKNKIIITLLVACFAVTAFAAVPINGKFGQKEAQNRDTDTWIDANTILMFVTNKGSFAYDQGGLLGKNDGLYFPYTGLANILDGSQNNSVIFASGIWVGAVDNATGDTLVSVAEYSDDYFPGPMTGTSWTPGADNAPQYRTYKLYSDSLADNPNQDYLDWPVADGAPVDSLGVPKMLGDQMCWAVYNDANPSPHINDASSINGLGVEIRQTTFAFAREGALANIVFLKFQIFNKGGLDLRDMFVSLWADPDLGDAGDDFVGSDTILSLGFCYNDGTDGDYADKPPAVGYDFFQGPLVFTGNNADTAIMWDFQIFPGYQNMPMTSFNKYINGTDPLNFTWTYQYMNGLDASNNGAPLPNGTKYAVPGDPVAGTGDLDANSSDRRYLLTTGPFDFAPGDSTEVVAAIVVGLGSNELNSITQLKLIDDFAQSVYDRGFILPAPPASPKVQVAQLDEKLVLEWGNESETSPGDYQFEGYSVFQGPTAAGPWEDTLGWFDIKNGVGAIIDSFFNLSTGDFFPRIVKPGPDKGIQRYLQVTTDKVNGGPLRNYTQYYFRVEAYSFDTTAVKGERTLTSATVVSGMPQPPLVGTELNADALDNFQATHVSGASDGSVVTTIIDPDAITGDSYRVSFYLDTVISMIIDTTVMPPDTTIDTTIELSWNVINTSSVPEDTVLKKWVNQAGDEDYPIVDGMLIKVLGPPPGFKNFEVVANASGPLNPTAAGALNFQGFPTPNDENPGDGTDTQPGAWAIHTGDSQPSGSRGSFDAFLSRVLRSQNGFGENLQGQDFEWRFTGSNAVPFVNGGYAWEAFDQGLAIWVPFEIWRIGVATPNDPSDDVRLIPWMIDNTRSGTFNLESYGDSANAPTGYVVGDPSTEHSASGGDNDPFTDWVYWFLPVDDSPGESGYQEFVDSILIDPVNYSGPETELMARTVLVSWNGGSAPPFAQDLPEVGTIFRITTNKPNGLPDMFAWSTAAYAPTVASTGSESLLDNIKAVPNPYYLFSNYDKSSTNRVLKFTNLPAKCDISIYNLAGHFITRLSKDDATTTEQIWDVTNDFNVPVASGIYIYVVDAPGFGQKIGKMAIFTEIEILGQY